MINKGENWEQRLAQQVKRRFDNYIRRRIDLSAARDLELWTIAGSFLYIEKASSHSANALIRLDKNTRDTLDLYAGVKIETIFSRFYISHDAQPGEWLELLIGIDFVYFRPVKGESAEAQPAVTQVCTLANTNYQLAAQICNAVEIVADVQNLGIVWVDFGQAAVQDGCRPLDPGDSICHRCSNLNRLNFNAEIAGDTVHVVPEY